jgi:hypothetical protein
MHTTNGVTMKKIIYFSIFLSSVSVLVYAADSALQKKSPITTEVTVPEILDTKRPENLNQSPSFEDLMVTEGSNSASSRPSTPSTPRASSLSQEESITPRGNGRSLKKILEESQRNGTSK